MFRFNLFRNQKTNDLLRVICCIISKKIDNKIIPPVPVASMPTCANTHTDTHTHTHTMDYYSAIRSEIMPFAAHGWTSVQFSSVAQSCPTLCDPINCSMPGLPVHHQFLEFTQTHVH